MRNIPFGKPIIGNEEKQAILNVLDNPILVHGPKSKEFEEAFAAYVGADYVVSVSSCTAALHLSYFNLELGPGDEVIVPAQTHTATAHAVEYCGAKPVFVDSELETGNIDIDQIESNITEKTKAISVVHFLGMPVNMDRINKIAQNHNLFVIEDCALAIGTYFKGNHAGLLGDVGCFSFYPVKHMTTAEGGMLITKENEIAEKIALQKAFGVNQHMSERKIPGVYDVKMLGYNYRMNEIEAALGIEQLKRIPAFLAKRKENYETLQDGLKAIDEIQLFQSTYGDFHSSYYCMSLILNDNLAKKREEIQKNLKENGIETSIYYPQAVPCFSYYKNKYGYIEADFPVATKISWHSIALPVGPHLNGDDMKYIVDKTKNIIHRMN